MTVPRLWRQPLLWVGVLYFTEGLPLGLYYDLLPVYLRAHGASLTTIGLLGPLGVAWTLKFLWAPAVDRLRGHRRWMLAADAGLALALAALSQLAPGGVAVLVACGALAWLSATNDIATDAYTIEYLAGRALGRANGVRIALYRVGMLASGGLLVLADTLGWSLTLLAAALLQLLAGMACRLAPPEPPRPQRPEAADRAAPGLRRALVAALCAAGFAWLAARQLVPSGALQCLLAAGAGTGVGALLLAPVQALLLRPGMGTLLAFALLYKAGDAAMGLMVKPFWQHAGFSLTAIGLVSVNLGLALSVAGGLAGGWLTDRWGLARALLWLGLAQGVSNLGYALAAQVIPAGGGPQGAYTAALYGASMLESFTGGLGTAAFLALLMAAVDRRFAATEYAVLSSVFALGRALAGFGGGVAADALGFRDFFLWSALVGLPALALIPWLGRALPASPQR